MRANFRTKTLRQSFASVAIMALAISATTAKAQDQQPAEAAQETDADDGLIVVTGSRIASPTTESAAPLQIIDDVAIDDSGVTNVQELLLENPIFGTPALSRTNSAFLTSGTGVASVDLRDLGSDRTLVLINGRRVVAGLPGSSIVDLNIIPTQFIEQVDVLTGGASSLYGSDAIAGVVNFVYKRDFEGIEANGQVGTTEQGDDLRYQANLTFGTNVADGRGNIMVHFGYSNEEGVLSRQRENTFTDDFSLFRLTGDPADFGTPSEPFFSSGPGQGRFDTGDVLGSFRTNAGGQFVDANDVVLDIQDPTDPGFLGVGVNENRTFTFDPETGAIRPCFSTNGGTGGANVDFPSDAGVNSGCDAFAGQAIGPDGFNRQFFRTIAVPVERYLFAAAGSYEVTDNINLFFEGTYSKTKSERIIEPFFLSSEDIYPNNGGIVPIETVSDGTTFVNPFVPQAIVDSATDLDGDGLRDVSFVRRITEFGPRQGSTTRDTYRFVVGFDGTLFDDKFRWDASYNFGSTSENQFSSGQINTVNFRNALAAIPDVNDANNNGSTDDVVCADPAARAQGCVPINIFGANTITPEAIAYSNAESSFQTDITQQVIQGNISGSLFELPGGSAGIAAGVEYRRESSTEELDALTNAGLNGGNALPDTEGSFNVVEGYMEVKLPILADMPGFQLLEVGGAVRVADYSTVGTVVSYNGTVTWQPIDDIRLRGTYSRAVRAPNIGELFTGPSQTFPAGLTDPCAGVTLTDTSTLGVTCRSFAGVTDNINANGGAFVLSQPDIQGISGFNSGNPDLQEEKADSWTVGAVINPRSINALRNLTITVDYWNIKIEDVIAAPPRQFILDQCFGEGNQEFCELVTRRAVGTAVNSPGSIEFINAPQGNAASLEADGLDVVVSYRTGLEAIGLGNGSLSGRVSYSHLFNNNFQPTPTAPVDPSAGEIGTAKDKFTANLAYSDGPFRLSFTGTYIGASDEDDQFLAAFNLNPGDIGVGAEFYLDTQLNYKITEEFEFYFGVDNLLDNDAPNILSGTTFNVTGTDTAADVYDVFGRRYYSGVRMRF